MATSNHYQVLELSESATQSDKKQAYRRLAKQYHPDSRGDAPGDHEQFAQINAAYEVLGDPAARKRYDSSTKSGVGPTKPLMIPLPIGFAAFTTPLTG